MRCSGQNSTSADTVPWSVGVIRYWRATLNPLERGWNLTSVFSVAQVWKFIRRAFVFAFSWGRTPPTPTQTDRFDLALVRHDCERIEKYYERFQHGNARRNA